MKPIRLSISGLHSFREKQEIDFTSLTEMGLFGIFGPTGSGKSTILDAITLALYGDVGRAGHNTQAILNHAEKRLEVVFDFEIGSPDRRKRHRVERAYKRGDGFSVAHQASRLLELEVIDGREDYGIIVIADTKTSVNQAVQTILGLQQSDFTRAVVLPQGKFAEFLQLTGSDRNLMSERLFGLERYGRALHERVRTRSRQVTAELERVIAAQAELGDASDEAVEVATTAVEEAKRLLASAQQKRQEVLARYQEAEQVYSLTGQLNETILKRDELNQQADVMNRVRQSLAQNAEADAMWPFVVTWREVQEEMVLARTAVESTAEKLAQAQTALTLAAKHHEEAEQNRVSREPELVQQKGRLQDALELWRQLLSNRDELKSVETAHETAVHKRDEIASALTGARQAVDNLKQKRAKAEAVLVEHTMSAEIRSQLGRLREAFNLWTSHSERELNAREMYETREAQRQIAQDELRHCTEAISALRDIEVQLKRKQDDVEAQTPAYSTEKIQSIRVWKTRVDSRVEILLAAEEELGEAKRRCSAAHAEWQAKLEATQALKEQAERCHRVVHELEQERQHRTREDEVALITKLAETLTTGSPCPVCGATHHPSPASLETESKSDATNSWSEEDEAAFAQAEQSWGKAEAEFQQADRVCTRMETSAQMIDEDVQRKRHNRHGHIQDLAQSWPTGGLEIVGVDEIPEDGKAWQSLLNRLDESLVKADELLHSWEEQRNTLDGERSQIQERIHAAEHERALADAKCATAEQECSRQKTAIEEAMVLQNTAAEELAKVMEKLGLQSGVKQDLKDWMNEDVAEVVRARLARFDDDDRVAGEAQRSLIELDAKLTDAQQRLSVTETERQGAEWTVQEHVLKIEQLRRTVSEQDGRIKVLTGGLSVEDALAVVEGQLNDLNAAYQNSKSAKESAAIKTEEAQRASTQAQAQLQSQSNAAVTANRHLSDALARTNFATVQAVEDALLNEGDRAAFEQAVIAHDEAVNQCRHQIAELERQLAGRSMDDETFASRKQARDEAEEVYREAMTLTGSKQQLLNDLLDRKERWQKLDRDRVEKDALSRRLGALQSSLQGNRFVQFLAREQMERVARQASERLSSLTHGRYALTLTNDGNFLMRDDHNGGALRPVSTLSGGETFLTSLSLALALSAHIQLRGQHPLEFFFLDEGFGTLDPDLLDVVISSLEKLHMERLSIGLISHVPELRQRMLRRLIVEPALPAGRGTKISLEMA